MVSDMTSDDRTDVPRRTLISGRTLVELAPRIGMFLGDRAEMVEVDRTEPRPGGGCGRRGTGGDGTGILAHFDPRRSPQCAEALKRSHPRWGADRVRIELAKDPALHEVPLPKRSRLAAFFKARCPACVTVYKPRPPAPRGGRKASAVT